MVGKTTAIEWTDATFNPWWGCERVSPACAHCYAADLAKRWGEDLWATGAIQLRSDGYWRKPHAWNREARTAHKPMFVFCASMADVFQADARLDAPRERLWETVEQTPWLVWLLLTKRPENIAAMLPWREAPDNVWLGTSIENARWTFRVRHLTEVPAPVHFLSCEPLLGSLFEGFTPPSLTKLRQVAAIPPVRGREPLDLADIEWVIGGGESGPKFRAVNPEHARELRDACAAAKVPFFWKQNGGRTPKAGGKNLDGREWCERPQPATPSRAMTLF